MIATLRGTLTSKAPTEIVIEIQGIGYALAIPLSTFERLGDPGTACFLYTHEHIREDAHQLFGFATDEERGMFRLLLSVNGIGPKMALGVLSGIPVTELRGHIAEGNRQALVAIPGIGRKLADRLILELREKLGRSDPFPVPSGAGEQTVRLRNEALLALLSLGYPRPAAEKALRAALQLPESSSATLEQLIKLALRNAGSA